MNLNWKTIDRYLMGEAGTGSRITEHAQVLCEQIDPRRSSSLEEAKTIHYIQEQMVADWLDRAEAESFELHTWSYNKPEALTFDDRPVELVPFNRCPPRRVDALLVDVGFGASREDRRRPSQSDRHRGDHEQGIRAVHPADSAHGPPEPDRFRER